MSELSLFHKISIICKKEGLNILFRTFSSNTFHSALFCLKYIISFIIMVCFVSNFKGVVFTKEVFFTEYFKDLIPMFFLFFMIHLCIFILRHIFLVLEDDFNFKRIDIYYQMFLLLFSFSFLNMFRGYPNIDLYKFSNIFVAHLINFYIGFFFCSLFIVFHRLYKEKGNIDYYNNHTDGFGIAIGKAVKMNPDSKFGRNVTNDASNEYKKLFYEKHDLYKGIAYHEAGHVVMTLLENLSVEKVCFNFEFESNQGLNPYSILGYSQQVIPSVDFNLTIEQCIRQVKINLAGSVANEIYCEKEKIAYHLSGNNGDFNTAISLATKIVEENGYSTEYKNLNISMLPNKEKYKMDFLKQQQLETKKILEEHWELVDELAKELLDSKDGLLNKEEILNIYNKYLHKKNSLN